MSRRERRAAELEGRQARALQETDYLLGVSDDTRSGWRSSPAHDLNPTPDSPHILSTRIDHDDATASIELLRSVAEFFVAMNDADRIINECREVVKQWKDYANARGASAAEVKSMQCAFEHEEMGV